MVKIRVTPMMEAIARANGLTIVDNGKRIEIYKGKRLVTFGVTPKIVLGMAITILETGLIPKIIKPLDIVPDVPYKSTAMPKGVVDPDTGVEDVAGKVVDSEKYKYDRVKLRLADGRVVYSANNQDAVSKALFGIDNEGLRTVVKDNNLMDKLSKHFKKNLGHFRMIVGQSLRHKLAREGKIHVFTLTITNINQKIDWPKGVTELVKKPRKE